MKNAEAAISSWMGEVKSLRTGGGGLKNFRTGGGYRFGGGYFCWGVGGVSTPLHAMSIFKKSSFLLNLQSLHRQILRHLHLNVQLVLHWDNGMGIFHSGAVVKL